jgi:hypothetical protein
VEGVKSQTLQWTGAECPYSVTVPATVLDEIRAAVIEAYYSVPRGGVEIGGVFFGTLLENSLHIQTYRPIVCQYLYGPAFKLSLEDQEGLSAGLKLPASDPELAGLTAVGWYHSHNRSEIFLSADDLHIYRQFFPERWQIALVLRPAHLKPTRAGFFFRDLLGGIKSDAPIQELIMDPPSFGLLQLDTEVENAVAQAEEAHAAAPEPDRQPAPPEGRRVLPLESPDAAAHNGVSHNGSAHNGPDHNGLDHNGLDRDEPELPAFELKIFDIPDDESSSAPRALEMPVEQKPKTRQEPPKNVVRAQPVKTNGVVRSNRQRPHTERRSARRESGEGLFAHYWDGGSPRSQKVIDISLKGSYIETDFPWMRGTLMLVTLQIGPIGYSEDEPPDAILVPAEVVRTSPKGMGLRFLFPNVDDIKIFLDFLSRWNPASVRLLLGNKG